MSDLAETLGRLVGIRSAVFEELYGFVQGLAAAETDPEKVKLYERVLKNARQSANGKENDE